MTRSTGQQRESASKTNAALNESDSTTLGSITDTLVSVPVVVTGSQGSSSGSDNDNDEDDDEDETEFNEAMNQMQDLLEKAKGSARAKAASRIKADELKDQTEVVLFGEDDDSEEEAGIEAGTSVAKGLSSKQHSLPFALVAPVVVAPSTKLSALEKGKGRATVEITLAQSIGAVKGDAWGKALPVHMSKKERKSQTVPTAGPKWFNMPAQTMTPELKREVQAMRLRNALDPKRFYKGGAKDDKTMPEFFQLGHIMPSTTSASTAPASIARKRTFVEELVDDEQAKAYTKKKFQNEIVPRGMSGRSREKKGGRGKGRGGKR